MATTFSTFDTTPSGAVAAIKAAILASTDWSNPAGDRVVCTTTRGADMVVDLADAAATALRMQLGVYRTTGLADKVVRYIGWRNSGGATSDTIHVTVSAGKEHLFISIEGPRIGEVNPADSSVGSPRQYFYIGDIVPYHAADAEPAVVLVGNTQASGSFSDTLVHVSRNQADNASWVTAYLLSMQVPFTLSSSSGNIAPSGAQRLASDGKYYMWPYLVVETVAGLRGRIASAFLDGFNFSGQSGDFPSSVFARRTIGSATYILLPVGRHGSFSVYGPFGKSDSGSSGNTTPVVAIPYS